MDSVISLGSAFRGQAVPDGVALCFPGGSVHEFVTYDCKSKAEDAYSLSAGDADQQSRYLQFHRSLENTRHWKSKGILLFTPTVKAKSFKEKTIKGPCHTAPPARTVDALVSISLPARGGGRALLLPRKAHNGPTSGAPERPSDPLSAARNALHGRNTAQKPGRL